MLLTANSYCKYTLFWCCGGRLVRLWIV